MGDHQEDELLDYEEEDAEHDQTGNGPEAAADGKKAVKGSYVSIHSSGFRDFLLKPELLRAIVDCGFEHPSEGKVVFELCTNYEQFLCQGPSASLFCRTSLGCVVGSLLRGS